MSMLQKKEWLCLTCQTQRLMSGGGLDDPPLPVPHPSPKHQAMGSPRHQAASTSQQSPLHKSTSHQGQKPAQSQVQKPPMGADGSSLFASTAAKQQATVPGPAPTTETQRQPKPTEEKLRTEAEIQTAKESKPAQKKGEQIVPIKDLKKSRHYDVSQIAFLKCSMHGVECVAGPTLLLLRFSIKLDHVALVKHHMPLLVSPTTRNTSVYLFGPDKRN